MLARVAMTATDLLATCLLLRTDRLLTITYRKPTRYYLLATYLLLLTGHLLTITYWPPHSARRALSRAPTCDASGGVRRG